MRRRKEAGHFMNVQICFRPSMAPIHDTFGGPLIPSAKVEKTILLDSDLYKTTKRLVNIANNEGDISLSFPIDE
jgi:hypothetical protein